MRKRSWISVALIGLPLGGAGAADTPDDQLQTIVVVGQKENQSLQLAPEAITALSADTLRENFIRAPEDLNSQIPSLVIGQTDGYNNVVAIRGIGLNSPQDDGSPASVSFHQNGIFIPDPISLATNFLDVDHIEVLRGPQGTVFGQNSVGGTVNVITVLPKLNDLSGYTNLEYGSYDLKHVQAAINLPATSTLSLRIAADWIYQQGYATATKVPGGGLEGGAPFQLDNDHNYHVRLMALFQPIDDFSLLASVEYAKTDQNEIESKNVLDPNPNPYDESSDWPGRYFYNQTLGSLIATYNFGSMVFKSSTGVEYTNQTGSNSESGLYLTLATDLYGGENDQYWLHDIYSATQEFDLSSKPGGPIDWVVGLFYLHSRTQDGYDQYLRNPSQPGAPNILSDEVESLIAPEIAAGTLYFETSNTFWRQSISEFGQAVYHFSDALRGTVGFRYTDDRNHSFLDNYFGDPLLGGGFVHLHQAASKLTWKVGLDYQITPQNFVYGSVSTGFKPGGGNPGTAPAVVPPNYAPETITAFEVGSKNTELNDRLIANVAAFYYNDKNMQYHAEDLINFDGGVDNLPKVNIYGFEGELTALLPYHFKVSGNVTAEHGKIATHVSTIDNLAGNAANNEFIALYGYNNFLSAEFGVNPPGLPNAVAILTSLRAKGYRDAYGNPPPNLPEYTATVALSQTSSFANGANLMSRLQVEYRDHYANTVFTNPIYITPSYLRMNLLFDYTLPSGKMDVSFAVNNVANRAEVSYRFTNQYGGETTQMYFAPREYIAGFRYRF
ncbi:MAG TPA: TonB-dependent receptor [Steroidobacteraceae bacterium]|nr:TonB-dependent receptor [Steroidobacteraceae bacterium]